MEPLSNFAISLAAGIALDVWKKSKHNIDNEIKKVFNQALKDWCINITIREKRKSEIKRAFLEIANKPESFSNDYKCYGEYEKFYIAFDKRLCQHQVAYNYIKGVQDSVRYKEEISKIDKIDRTTEDTNKKVTEVLGILTNENPPLTKSSNAKTSKPIAPIPAILFNNYKKEHEKFYHERMVDTEFCSCIDLGNVWIFGFSGIGKTALVNRNLINKSIEYIYCDFSPVDIKSPTDVIVEIIGAISQQYQLEFKLSEGCNIIKEACSLLAKVESKEIVVVVDELSINNELHLKEISELIVKLINHHCNKSSCNCLKFVISTIEKPVIKKSLTGKAFEYFQFIEIDQWENDLEKLLLILIQALAIDLDEEMRKIIMDNCKKSPRLLKTILRKLSSKKSIDFKIVEFSSTQTNKEHY